MGIDPKQPRDTDLKEKKTKSLTGYKKLPPDVLKPLKVIKNRETEESRD